MTSVGTYIIIWTTNTPYIPSSWVRYEASVVEIFGKMQNNIKFMI